MTFSPGLLFFIGVGYLSLLFLVAHATEQRWIPTRWTRHPMVHVLSLGVFVSTWGLFGAVQFTLESGFNFLAFYLGLSGAFLLAPVLLQPLLRLARTHQLDSLPDLLAFRFRSQAVGTLATVATLLGTMPLLTTQIQTVAEVAVLMSDERGSRLQGLIFCAILVSFLMLFGARSRRARHQTNEGLVAAIAAESLIKLIAIAAIGLYAYFNVLGGSSGLERWLAENPEALVGLYQPLRSNHWHSLLIVFFFAAVVTPCMYQLAFTESREPRHLLVASWGLPLYLLLMALGIPIILWAGQALALNMSPEFYALGIANHTGEAWLPLLLFIGALASSSGILIVTTLALANMTMNHVVLPVLGWQANDALYEQTLRQRRLITACIPLAAFMLSWLPDLKPDSSEMSMLSFVAVLQLAPGLVALLFWPRATRQGLLLGLSLGMLTWFVTLVIPAFLDRDFDSAELLGLLVRGRLDYWQAMGLISTLVNIAGLLAGSLLSRQSDSDVEAAQACSVDNLRSPVRWGLSAQSPEDFIQALAPALGPVTAEREVRMAMTDLGFAFDERRPYALRRLHDQLHANLSGLLGPSVAQDLMDTQLPQTVHSQRRGDDIHFIESRLEEYRDRLSGLAAELDVLRRFHRQTLHDLPLGVCTLASDLEILSWNRAMMEITQCSDDQVIGARLDALPQPWRELLLNFFQSPDSQHLRTQVTTDGQPRWFNLHRAMIGDANGNHVLVMEDVSALQQLESRLHHAERLAAIGRLAAGVAHEIGNPVTGIACLAQNLKAEQPGNTDVQQATQDILEQTQRVSRIVQSLVGFSRSDWQARGLFGPVDLASTVHEAVQLLQLAPEGRQQRFRIDIPGELRVNGDAQRLCQVFINLLSNARDASTQQGEIHVRGEHQGRYVSLEIEDFGHGLPDGSIRDTLFEPFVTTKPAGKGTGLGLALVHGIISAHQGRVQLIDKRDYDQGQGVIVQVKLLAWQDAAPADAGAMT